MPAAVGNLNITTGAASTTVAVTGLPFGPTVVIFWWSGLTAASNGTRTTSRRGVGWAVSDTGFFAQSTLDTDAVGTAASKNNASTSGCVIEIDNTGAIVGRADLQSFDADSFTLEIQDQFVTDLLVSYVAIGGTDHAETGVLSTPGVTGNQTTDNVGNFKPDITLFAVGSQIASGADSLSMLGAATGASNQGVLWGGANDNSGTAQTGVYCTSAECIATHQASPAVSPTGRAQFVSHNSGPGGFTLNWVERNASSPSIAWLSIKGCSWAVGNFLTQTNTVTPVVKSGFGFPPKAVLFASAGNTETVADAAPAAHDKWSVGAAAGPSSRAVQQTDSRSGQTDTYVHCAVRTDAVGVNTDPNNVGYTLTGLVDLVSLDADGFTVINDDADSAQSFVWFLAVGDTPPTPHPLMLLGVG